MGIQYRKAKVTLNFSKAKPQGFKLMQLTYPAVSFEQLVAECAVSCGVNPSQTRAVVDALLDRLVHYMDLGHGVRMGSFGSFKPTFNSKVVKTLEDATPKTVRLKKVQFYPGKAFKEMLSGLSLTAAAEALDVKEETAAPAGEPEGGEGGE